MGYAAGVNAYCGRTLFLHAARGTCCAIFFNKNKYYTPRNTCWAARGGVII